ncbi:MAG: methionine--tRNA ligase [Puniceicoccales bacterium]|jgi:methionyl-tRNA synthetase|nr:methionine--tRNA ligase [Puniceicoccales bacterium]
MKKVYITTAIDYANGKPHIGHAYEKILADTVSRMFRLQNMDVQFMTGLDEHGLKVSQSAAKAGIPEQIHCDNVAEDFKNLCKKLSIKYDRYIRTTESEHKQVVRECLQKLYDDGQIYKADYSGLYSKTAERFVLEKDKIDGKWPADYGEVIEISETNYFFQLKKYQGWLINYIEAHPEFIFPTFRAKQVLEFLKDPINDLCISRPKNRLSWGIELPFDSEYVTYVWFDALINYITGANYLDKTFTNYWPTDYHIIGKDILVPAHAVYWPIMLYALNIELPKTLLVHGWWLVSGEKMSKSSGNVVNPLECIEKFGVDAFRYYLMREMTIGQDGDFSFDRFMTRYTGDLANDLGNLLSRLLNMGHRYCNGTIKEITKSESLEEDLQKLWQSAIPEIISLYNEFAFHLALEKLFLCIKAVNGYVENRSPWKLAKSSEEGDKQLVNTTIAISAECVRLAAILLSPVMPTTSQQILSVLGCPISTNWSTDAKFGNSLTGNKLGEQIILFPKIEQI